MLALAACTKVEPSPADPPAAPAPTVSDAATAPEGEGTVLLGMVHEGGVRNCDESGNESWSGLYWAVGFTPVVHDEVVGKALASLEGRVVLVEGVVTDAEATVHGGGAPPSSGMLCPMMQMRSDWELWPNGIRSRRGDEPEVGTLHLRSVEAAEPFRARVDGDEVVFAVTNPLGTAMRDATLIAHYEGCYGKPGTASERRPLGTIEAGATLDDIPVPRIETHEGPRGRNHRLSAVRIRGDVDGAVLDLDVPVSSLGVTVECPRKGRK